MVEEAARLEFGYQIVGWTNFVYFGTVFGYAEYLASVSNFFKVKDYFGDYANSKWLCNATIRIMLPLTTGIYGIMFLLSLFWPAIYGNFYTVMMVFTFFGLYGLNIVATFWDDIYRWVLGDITDQNSLNSY